MSNFRYRSTCEREIEALSTLGKALEHAGGEVVDHARAIAPVRTGAYAASLRASSERTGAGWTGHASADVAYAGFVEFGTSVPTPEFAPLRKGAAATTGLH